MNQESHYSGELETTRRAFLLGAAGAIATKPALAGADSGLVSLGFSLYGMRMLPLNEALRVCAQTGYDSVELVATQGWPCDPSNLRATSRRDITRQLQDQRLSLSSIMENLNLLASDAQRQTNLDRLKAAAELGHELSPDAPPVLETVLGGRSSDWTDVKSEMAKELENWADVGEATKTIVAIKAHIGGALHTPHDAKWLIDQVDSPWIRLNYDYSHFQLGGFALESSLQAVIGDAVFIHVKDKLGPPGRFQFQLPGDGHISYARYWQVLRKSGYRGAVTVEVSGHLHSKPGYDPIVAARRSYRNLAPSLEAAGIRTRPV